MLFRKMKEAKAKENLKKLFACERICNKMGIYTYEISEGDTICIMNGAMESYNKSASA